MPDREAVHQALAALYDNVRLAQCALCRHFPHIQAIPALDERAESLRSLVLEALDSLRPAHRQPFGSPLSRGYDVLRLRYLERMRISQVEEELSLGRRQVFRDLEEAEAKLAEVLASWADAGRQGGGEERDSLSDELLALVSSPGRVDLAEVVAQALSVVERLAAEAGKGIAVPPEMAAGQYVLADAAILRQLLVQLLCCALQATDAAASVDLGGGGEGAQATVTIGFAGRLDPTQERRLLDAQRIAESQGMGCRREEGRIVLELRRGRPASVLVVEDNPGAVELYRRYLSSGSWQVHAVSDPTEAAEAALALLPDVIVLDIMMPRLDGWTVLSGLRGRAETAAIPVVICSIVEQPELGAALGASACLTKPVAQGELLATVGRCLREGRLQRQGRLQRRGRS